MKTTLKIDTIGLEVSLLEIRLLHGALEQWVSDIEDSILESDENELLELKTANEFMNRLHSLCHYGTHDHEGYLINNDT